MANDTCFALDNPLGIDANDHGNLLLIGTELESVPQIKITLTESVNEAALERAVSCAQRRYLLLRVSCVRDTHFSYIPNERPFIITREPLSEPKTLGAGNNGYPWKVTYWENYFVFTFLHGVVDGRGALEFIKTILYYYAASEGINVPDTSNIKTLNDNIPACEERELEKTYFKNENCECDPLPLKKLGRGSTIRDDLIRKDHREHHVVLHVPTREFIAAVKRFDSSPYALTAPLLGEALRPCYSEDDPLIKMLVTCDMRTSVGSDTLRNCIMSPAVAYYPVRMSKIGLDHTTTIFKTRLDMALNKDNCLNEIKQSAGFSRLLNKIRPLSLRIFVSKFLITHLFAQKDDSVIFSNVGVLRLPPELAALVEEAETMIRCFNAPIALEMMGTPRIITFSFTHYLTDDSFIHRFAGKLEEFGVSSSFEDRGPYPINRFYYE